MSKARLVFDGDNIYTKKTLRTHKLAQEIETKINAIPWVINNLTSTSNTDALSANQWRLLQDQINELKSMWRFLSSWNCVTWLPKTNPADDPYDYKVWDYYIVNSVWVTNYRPHGSYYRHGEASTDVETETVRINDWYLYDWSNWILQNQEQITITIDSDLSLTSLNAVQNRVITNALSQKQDTINDLSAIRANAALWATALQPWGNISELINDSNFATQWYVQNVVSTAVSWKVNDTAFWTSWDWSTDKAPSQNAVYDKINSIDNEISSIDDEIVSINASIALKQDQLIEWNNIQIDLDTNEISAIDTIPNDGTVIITQAWVTKWDFSMDQSNNETIDLIWDILVTQADYNNLPSSKNTDWNFYFIYS